MPAGRARTIVCDVRALAGTDLAAVDVLARLLLGARRLGLELRLRGASPRLAELVALAGLDGLLLLEPQRQAEEREQPLRVEEEADLDDPPA